MRIIIIGGGIIGLCSAWYLQKTGHEIIVLDKGDFSDGCSFGNAGMITPSHIIPLAAPGMIAKGIRWMFNAESPFYIKPRLDLELLRWGWLFYRSATSKKVRHAMTVLRDFNWMSKRLYIDMIEQDNLPVDLRQKGILMIYRTPQAEDEELALAEKALQLGIQAEPLSMSNLQQKEPHVLITAKGAVHYPGDVTLSPQVLMRAMIDALKQKGVHFHSGTLVKGFEKEKGSVVGIQSTKGLYRGDAFVVAGGTWTPTFTKYLGLKLPMQAGKGYSFMLKNMDQLIQHPAILIEAKIAVTPMGTDLRFAGTMEIAGLHERINPRRVNGILKAIPDYYPELELGPHRLTPAWCGLRPCTPDGLPYIGVYPGYKNVVLAAGHAMQGLSFGAATGKLVQELIGGTPPSIDMRLFDISRFG